jgi:hypothetical protein
VFHFSLSISYFWSVAGKFLTGSTNDNKYIHINYFDKPLGGYRYSQVEADRQTDRQTARIYSHTSRLRLHIKRLLYAVNIFSTPYASSVNGAMVREPTFQYAISRVTHKHNFEPYIYLSYEKAGGMYILLFSILLISFIRQ